MNTPPNIQTPEIGSCRFCGAQTRSSGSATTATRKVESKEETMHRTGCLTCGWEDETEIWDEVFELFDNHPCNGQGAPVQWLSA